MPIAPEPLLTSLLVIMLGPSCFGDVVLKDLKPFKDYQELAQLLIDRGMDVPDEARAVRKLSQVGYYRLSGFWYACRTQAAGSNKPLESFLPGTCFDRIFELYLFDKRLRLLFLDAIERIEVSLKTRLAHELGRLDSQAHHNPDFINPKQLKSYVHRGVMRNAWDEWSRRQQDELDRCREDFIQWHKTTARPVPVWVAVEAWSLGTVSKWFELLKRGHQNRIARHFGVSNPALLVRWLQAITTLRNRCAHHSRIWNQTERNALGLPVGVDADALFFKVYGSFDAVERKKIFMLACIIWYLVRSVGPSSDWFDRFMIELQRMPGLPCDGYEEMGVPKAFRSSFIPQV